jgi:K+-transporting ATPase ATPase A chain
MTSRDLLQVLIYFAALLILAPFIGRFMARVFQGERTWLSPILGPMEHFTYRLSGIKPAVEMNWRQYAFALMVFNLIGFRSYLHYSSGNRHLPLNPQKIAGCAAASGAKHRRKLHDQHELAGLFWRKLAQLS